MQILKFLKKHKDSQVLFVAARTAPYPLHLDNGEVVMKTYDSPHCEVHFDKEVQFWSYDNKLLGKSKVYKA